MSGSQMDPRDRMRARDLREVTRGEQTPRPAHEYGTVSPPPPPSSTDHINVKTKNKEEKPGTPQTDYQTRHCYVSYVVIALVDWLASLLLLIKSTVWSLIPSWFGVIRSVLQKGKKDLE